MGEALKPVEQTLSPETSIIKARRKQSGTPTPAPVALPPTVASPVVLPLVAAAPVPSRIFIVHGHDLALRAETARVLEKWNLMPVILSEQAGAARTLIEKLERETQVKFAIVLLTPDDEGRGKSDENQDLKPRARQNVIFELGFFAAQLGRNNLIALFSEEVELPSDYLGVQYIKVDSDGAWQFKLGKELREAGFAIDLNKL